VPARGERRGGPPGEVDRGGWRGDREWGRGRAGKEGEKTAAARIGVKLIPYARTRSRRGWRRASSRSRGDERASRASSHHSPARLVIIPPSSSPMTSRAVRASGTRVREG